MSVMFVGEGLYTENKADGSLDLDNVAHIDLLVGPKDGPVGQAFATALANQSAGHTTCWPSSAEPAGQAGPPSWSPR